MRVARVSAVALLLGLPSGACPLFCIDIALQYRTAEPRLSWFPGSRSFHALGATCPHGAWKLPTFQARYPLHSLLRMGDQSMLVVLDRREAGSLLHDAIHVDANGNGALADDKVLACTLQKSDDNRAACVFKPVAATVTCGGVAVPYSFEPSLAASSCSRLGDAAMTAETTIQSMSWSILCAAYYTGTLTLDGSTGFVDLGASATGGLSLEQPFTSRAIVDEGDRTPWSRESAATCRWTS